MVFGLLGDCRSKPKILNCITISLPQISIYKLQFLWCLCVVVTKQPSNNLRHSGGGSNHSSELFLKERVRKSELFLKERVRSSELSAIPKGAG